jgi:cytochrome c oxidase cbb3-type subunit 2
MNSLRRFVLGLAVTFGLPWLVLVVVPTFKNAGLGSVVYEDAEGNQKYYPESSAFTNGQLVYRAEGCANCHTQIIRPQYAGFDGQRKGWGRDQEARPGLTRPSRARDYLGESYAFLGVQRNGPDLGSVGYRIRDEKWHHAHLFNPQSMHDWSIMPSFRHLYEKQLIQGTGSEDAVATEGDYEYVPSDKARALVRYLLSLQKDSPAPVGNSVSSKPPLESSSGAGKSEGSQDE